MGLEQAHGLLQAAKPPLAAPHIRPVTLRTRSDLDPYIGAPIGAGDGAGLVIPLARKLGTGGGEFAGLAVAAVPAGPDGAPASPFGSRQRRR